MSTTKHENPNEYDDGAYVEATMTLPDEVGDIVRAMWQAGGSVDDIRNEVTQALDVMLRELGGID